MKSKILAANHVLFGNVECVRELEQFFVAAVEKANANPPTDGGRNKVDDGQVFDSAALTSY